MVKQGDAEDFRRFVEETLPGFLRTAYALLGDSGAAEDAAQAALIRTYRHWEKPLEHPGGFTWRVLVNVCRDEQRRRSRLPKIATTSELPDKATPKMLADAVAARHDLTTALRGLPYKLREVVVLRYYLELSVHETAQALGIPEGSVKSATSRALLQLKRRLSPDSKELDDADR